MELYCVKIANPVCSQVKVVFERYYCSAGIEKIEIDMLEMIRG